MGKVAVDILIVITADMKDPDKTVKQLLENPVVLVR